MLAGFMAGCAGWTKNEGLLFLAAYAWVWADRRLSLATYVLTVGAVCDRALEAESRKSARS